MMNMFDGVKDIKFLMVEYLNFLMFQLLFLALLTRTETPLLCWDSPILCSVSSLPLNNE